MRHLLLPIVTCISTIASAQSAHNRGSLGGGIGLSIPTCEFGTALGKNLFHANAHFAYPLGRIPFVQGGLAFGYSVLGEIDRTVPVNTDYLGITEGTINTRDKVFSYHTFLRLCPLGGRIRPYVDGLAGFRQFRTTSRVTAEGVEGRLSKEANQSDLAFSAGWAAGVMVTFGKLVYVEARVEHFNSGEATYADPNSVSISDQGVVGFNTLTSRTDATNITAGIGLVF